LVDLDQRQIGGFFNAVTPDRQWPLRHGVHLTVRALKRRLDQRAALQTSRVPQGRYVDVDLIARLQQTRQLRRHHDGRNVHGAQLGCIHLDPELGQHVRNALEGGLDALGVPRALQADHEAVTHQLVLTDTFDLPDGLETDHGSVRNRGAERHAPHHQDAKETQLFRLAHVFLSVRSVHNIQLARPSHQTISMAVFQLSLLTPMVREFNS
jgi:hypothetical protein